MSFATDDLQRLAAAEEIEIETQAPDGPVHRTIIWVMVEGGDVFLRSVRGDRGRWFREASANPAIAVHVGGRRLAVTAIPATDPDSIERVDAALTGKYLGIEGYVDMLEPAVRSANFRLEPT